MAEKTGFATDDIFKMAAIKLLANRTPDRLIVVLGSEKKRDRVTAMYEDEGSIPATDDLQEWMIYRDTYLQMKHECFKLIDEERERRNK